MNKVIIPCGYMGSGSSAVTNLIEEFEGYDADNGTFEYVFLHCPDGLFDLEDKLLVGNNAIRSDEALHSFYLRMHELYSKKLWWVADYKNRIGEDFLNITNDFINSIKTIEIDNYWYMQQKPTVSRIVMLLFRKILNLFLPKSKKIKVPLNYGPMWVSVCSDEEFYYSARIYIKRIFDLLGINDKNLILDQLLLPFNLWRMSNYFDDNVECFVVDRDPRDMFIANKYIWSTMNETVSYPTDVEQFCDFYRRLKKLEKEVNNTHIHRVKFEDMIYKYDEIEKQVANILKIDISLHNKKYSKFIPNVSIDNTQLFRNPQYIDETKIIENQLKEYLYDFPYERVGNIEKSF